MLIFGGTSVLAIVVLFIGWMIYSNARRVTAARGLTQRIIGVLMVPGREAIERSDLLAEQPKRELIELKRGSVPISRIELTSLAGGPFGEQTSARIRCYQGAGFHEVLLFMDSRGCFLAYVSAPDSGVY